MNKKGNVNFDNELPWLRNLLNDQLRSLLSSSKMKQPFT